MLLDTHETSQTRRVAIVLVLLSVGIATAVAYYGTRERPLAAAPPITQPENVAFPVVQTIVLPHQEPELPPGSHREQARASCTVCHSPRLLLTQPPLSRDQWTGVVKKMVAVYGAPITLEEEPRIVEYLTEVHGP
jgi:hypothetical protein